jgi:hypothetical protein
LKEGKDEQWKWKEKREKASAKTGRLSKKIAKHFSRTGGGKK